MTGDANAPRDDGPCSAPGCGARAPFGFAWARRSMRSCRAHRARGQAWLDRIKGAGEAPPPAAPPQGGQGVLL